jgi:CheY-like chemotaxis protein
MERLVFIDDDLEELKSMKRLVAGAYELIQVHWPRQKPTEELIGEPPALFVSDLYLPPGDQPDDVKDLPQDMLKAHAVKARGIANRFCTLFPGPRNAKKRLKDTMDCLIAGRDLLDLQWIALRQSPDYGLDLFRQVKRNPSYGKVPFIFYSRKITPENVVEVLKAGATAAIRKQDWKSRDDFHSLLRQAQSVYWSESAGRARQLGMNVNTTLFAE